MSRSSFPSCSSRPALRRASAYACTRVALLLLLLTVPALEARAQQNSGSEGFVIQSVDLTNFAIVENVLTAAGTVTGTLAGLPFTTNFTNFALELGDDPSTAQVECSVLHLELAPLHLSLLGLRVDTGAICLDVSGTQGGGLLGDLLCGLAGGGLLGLPGTAVLPTSAQETQLEAGLVPVLNRSLGQTLTPAAVSAAQESVCSGDCEILELVLGPLDLSLLGLNVSLDDCEEGPVQVCVSASSGEGILGNLLCALTGPDLLNLTLADIAQLVRRTLALLTDGVLSAGDISQLTALLGRLIR